MRVVTSARPILILEIPEHGVAAAIANGSIRATSEEQMNGTSVYLSGQFEDGPVLRNVREDLIRAGCRVTSRWLNGDSSTPATARADEEGAAARLAAIAYQDIEDIRAADVVVVFNPQAACNVGRGGRHVETGYALAAGKKVVVVGARGNVFHWMLEVTLVDDWSGLLDVLLDQEPR